MRRLVRYFWGTITCPRKTFERILNERPILILLLRCLRRLELSPVVSGKARVRKSADELCRLWKSSIPHLINSWNDYLWNQANRTGDLISRPLASNIYKWAVSSVGQSTRFTSERSKVRVLYCPLFTKVYQKLANCLLFVSIIPFSLKARVGLDKTCLSSDQHLKIQKVIFHLSPLRTDVNQFVLFRYIILIPQLHQRR